MNAELLAAAFAGDIAAVDAAMAKGADIGARDERGWTALHVAVWARKPELVRTSRVRVILSHVYHASL